MSDILKREAIALFDELRAAFPNLTMRMDAADPDVDVSVEIPEQPGLAFHVGLNLQNLDELHLSAGDVFWCSWFPSSDSAVVQRYRDAVTGVLSGRNRIMEYRYWNVASGADLQAPTAGGWKTVARSTRGLWPFHLAAQRRVVQNAVPSNNELQRTRPAQARASPLNSVSADSGMIERFYRYEVVFAGALGAIAAIAGVFLLAGVVSPPSERPVIALTCILAVFAAWSLALRVAGQGRLAFPLSRAWHTRVVLSIILAFVAIISYGVSRWPAAPIRACGVTYVDKLGREHTRESFLAFLRWESAYLCLGLPFALAAITGIPAARLLRPNK